MLSLSRAISDGYNESAAARKFREFDVDGNGYLEGKELVLFAAWVYGAFRPGAQALSQAQLAQEVAKLLKRLDEKKGDGDGRITFDEFHAYHDEKIAQIAAFEKRQAERGAERARRAAAAAAAAAAAEAGPSSCYEAAYERLHAAAPALIACVPPFLLPPPARWLAATKMQAAQRGKYAR